MPCPRIAFRTKISHQPYQIPPRIGNKNYIKPKWLLAGLFLERITIKDSCTMDKSNTLKILQ